MRQAIATKIAEKGMTSRSAGAPFADSVMLGSPTINSFGRADTTESSRKKRRIRRRARGYGGPIFRPVQALCRGSPICCGRDFLL